MASQVPLKFMMFLHHWIKLLVLRWIALNRGSFSTGKYRENIIVGLKPWSLYSPTSQLPIMHYDLEVIWWPNHLGWWLPWQKSLDCIAGAPDPFRRYSRFTHEIWVGWWANSESHHLQVVVRTGSSVPTLGWWSCWPSSRIRYFCKDKHYIIWLIK